MEDFADRILNSSDEEFLDLVVGRDRRRNEKIGSLQQTVAAQQAILSQPVKIDDTDFMLIVLKDLVQQNPELRLIVMSATINTEELQGYFRECPVIEVSGKTFEVEEHFLEDCIKMLNFNTKEYEDHIETPTTMAETWRQSSASQHQCKPEEYKVNVDRQLFQDIESVLEDLNIQPVKIPKNSQTMSLTPEKKPNVDAEACPHMSGAVSWSPPQPNWNPWHRSNRVERPFADLTIKAISVNLRKEYKEKRKNQSICEPRRISAISVAKRIAEDCVESLGKSTGYSARFDSCFPRPYGSILVCTVGVLLRKLESGLRGITHIIVDEIHERDVNTDFMLIVLKDLVQQNPELRLIVMSATINTEELQGYFRECPVIEVSGKTFEVAEHFLEDCIKMLNFNTKEYEDYIETENSKKGIFDKASTEQVHSTIEEKMPFKLIKAQPSPDMARSRDSAHLPRKCIFI